jgi:CHAT domain-containing protein/Tfp pilus assembly protein PilF
MPYKFVQLLKYSLALLASAFTIGSNWVNASSPPVTTLVPERLITNKLAYGNDAIFTIPSRGGEFYRLVVGMIGADANLTVIGSVSGSPVHVVVVTGSTITLSIIAESRGQSRVSLNLSLPDSEGQYSLKVTDLRLATEKDRVAGRADAAFWEAKYLVKQQNDESQRRAIAMFERSLEAWRSIGDSSGETEALTGLGEVYSARSENEKSLEYLTRALEISRHQGDRRRESLLMDDLGSAYFNLGKPDRALDYLRGALVTSRDLSDARGEAGALNDLGVVESELGRNEETISLQGQALEIRTRLGDRRGQGETLTNLGHAYDLLGRKQDAIEAFMRALPLLRLTRDRYSEAATLNDIARVYSTVGEKQKALDHYYAALALEKDVVDVQGEANTTINIGSIYEDLGENAQALDHYEHALGPAQKIADPQLEMVAMAHIAKIKDISGNSDDALQLYSQALSLAERLKSQRWISIILNDTANVYFHTGKYPQALGGYEKALAIRRELGDRQSEAIALTNVGNVRAAEGATESALDLYRQTIAMARAAGDLRTEALGQFSIARLESAQQHFVASIAPMEEALRLIESLRTKIVATALRSSYVASVRDYFDFHIDNLMRLDQLHPGEGYATRALEIFERSRARSLLDLLVESRTDIRHGVDPELLARDRSLNERINYYADRRLLLASNSKTSAEAEGLTARIAELEVEYQQVESNIRESSPQYAALMNPRTLTAAGIESEGKAPDTVFLEYTLGRQRSFLWAIDEGGIHSWELPGREEINGLARQLYSAIATRASTMKSRRKATPPPQQDDQGSPAARLSAILLRPAKALLREKRLVIVADGSLQFIPFAALPDPQTPGLKTPLIIRHEIVYAPSLSAIELLREQTPQDRAHSKEVAIIADPVFDSSDPRLSPAARHASAPRKAMEPGLLRSIGARGPESTRPLLPRLPFSRLEAEAITALFPNGKVLKALDFDANIRVANGVVVGQSRIVHFATHGILNADDPLLSGLVLSLFDKQGRPQAGFLKLIDIFNLKLSADLVVLSGCQTALGKEISGEGVVGLARGFMYAGAPRVVASLWTVDDLATAQFMTRFYKALFEDKSTVAAALRTAQVSMWQQSQRRDPYYWASFLLFGDWR